MSSIFGQVGVRGRAAYNAAKGGVENLTRCLAVEFAKYDVYVNALAPGPIETPMTSDRDWAPVAEQTPLGRSGKPEEIANCATFLAAGDHYITGEVIAADGGRLAEGWASNQPEI